MRIALDQRDLGRRWGVHFMASLGTEAKGLQLMDTEHAFDAQPTLVTTANAGILSLFTTYVDPKIIEILVSPMKAAELYGEVKKGDWVTDTAAFPVAERTGVVSSYGDYSQDGMSDADVNWPQRQSYHYQTNTRWGEREMARMGEAKIDWANQKNMASVLTLNKYQNQIYLYGVANLQLYGGTNDPNLPAPIAPTVNFFTATADQIFTDILRLVQQAVKQGNGLIDGSTVFKLGISPANEINLDKTNQYNVNVKDQIKKNFNITLVTVPEFAINGGGGANGGTELLQLIPDSIEGQKVCEVAFTEKMRAHAIVTKASSWEQKKSQGAFGFIGYQPVFISQMLG